jgi:hypothetical protein
MEMSQGNSLKQTKVSFFSKTGGQERKHTRSQCTSGKGFPKEL